MIFPLLILLSLLTSTFSTYHYTLDFTAPTTPSQLQCLRNLNYYTIWPRIYSRDGVDLAGIDTILNFQNISNSHVTAGGVIVPKVGGIGRQQINELYEVLKSNGLESLSCFLKVSRSSAHWSTDTSSNLALINSMLERAQQLSIPLSIQTSFTDWLQITDTAKQVARANKGYTWLWYSNVYGPGVTGESQPNFDDFIGFGPFGKANVTMKQFAEEEVLCGLTVNRNVFNVFVN